MCTFFLVVAFRDARFLSGLYGRFSYIVQLMVLLMALRMGQLTGLVMVAVGQMVLLEAPWKA